MAGIPSIAGPVFLYETITASRRWQGYALRRRGRGIGIALAVAWLGTSRSRAARRRCRQLARVGGEFLLRRRGRAACDGAPGGPGGDGRVRSASIAHAAGWHICSSPSSRIPRSCWESYGAVRLGRGAGPGGGPGHGHRHPDGRDHPGGDRDPDLVTLAVSLLGCSLAIALSVSRVQGPRGADGRLRDLERLAPGRAALGHHGTHRAGRLPPAWFFKLSPFVLAYGPYVWPGYVDVEDVILFMAAAGGLSVAALSIRDPPPSSRRCTGTSPAACVPGRSGCERTCSPGGPVRRSTATPCSGESGTATGPHAWAKAGPRALRRRDGHGHGGRPRRRRQHGVGVGGDLLLGGVSFMATSFGLLLLSAMAPTTLTEERVRGSLDVLLTTPLPTRVIVLGKWWANYRRALPLVLLPALTGLFVAVASPEQPLWLPVQLLAHVHPASSRDRFIGRDPAVGVPDGSRSRRDELRSGHGHLVPTHRACRGGQRHWLRRRVDRLDHRGRRGRASCPRLVVEPRQAYRDQHHLAIERASLCLREAIRQSGNL